MAMILRQDDDSLVAGYAERSGVPDCRMMAMLRWFCNTLTMRDSKKLMFWVAHTDDIDAVADNIRNGSG